MPRPIRVLVWWGPWLLPRGTQAEPGPNPRIGLAGAWLLPRGTGFVRNKNKVFASLLKKVAVSKDSVFGRMPQRAKSFIVRRLCG